MRSSGAASWHQQSLGPQARALCPRPRRWRLALAMALGGWPAACRAARRPRAAADRAGAGADRAASRARACRADETRNRVAVLVPLTGRQCRARPVDPQRRQPRFARHRRRAHPDHRLRHRRAAPRAAANEALAEGNGLILGPLLAEDVRAVAPVARRADVPVIAFSNDVSVAGDGVYLMGFTPGQSIERVVAYARGARRRAASARWCPTGVYGERAGAGDDRRRSKARAGGWSACRPTTPAPAASRPRRPASTARADTTRC